MKYEGTYCPHCKRVLVEVLTTHPPKCPSCRGCLGCDCKMCSETKTLDYKYEICSGMPRHYEAVPK